MTSSSIESETQLNTQEVYRALKKRHFNAQTKEVDPDAYYCRPGNDFNGLSVRFSMEQHIQKRDVFKWHGIAEISVADIETLNLKLVKDKEDHANIVGVPRDGSRCRATDQATDNYEEFRDKLVYDDREAERLAGELAKRSRLVYVDS